ncbi:hypothetical protein HAZT_HAZT000346 [Hyalella azteca]|uniref:Uncharacterized protein n=1 Tax=Hyalella azteca TaxID=294128 RepID=A0A6A0HDL6_HYAAZ|nr:hypothetical protein HAZT_HAZT000346 [Hyalella azteca]
MSVCYRHEQRVRESMDDDSGSENQSNSGGSNNRPSLDRLNSPRMKRASRHVQKLNMGDSKDDIHVCIMCMRAIMNNKCLTKALVLELLAAICLVKGGHHMILNAFDNFKETCGDPHRFYTLMQYFSNPDCFHIEFMCGRFLLPIPLHPLFTHCLSFTFSLFTSSLFTFSLFTFSLFTFSLFIFSLFAFSFFTFSLFTFSLFPLPLFPLHLLPLHLLLLPSRPN